MSDDLGQQIYDLKAEAESLRNVLQNTRNPSKAGLIGLGRDPSLAYTQPDGPTFIGSLLKARSADYDVQRQGKEELLSMGSRPSFAPSESSGPIGTDADGSTKANLSSTTGLGAGYLIPNALVTDVIKQATAKNPLRSMLQVIGGTRTVSVSVPTEGLAPARATVIAEGQTKTNISFVLTNYTVTLYTLAQIFDVSNQLLRHSAGAAEALVRSKLARSWALGESYYILNGSGTSEPKGMITSMTGVSDFTTAHTASASTVAGNIRSAVAKAIQALAGRNRTAEFVLCNPGDLAIGLTEGSDNAGFFVNPDSGMLSLLGVPIRTTTSMPTKSAVVGEFSSAQLFVGDDYRIDTSSEAGTRWDTNLTGFRGEEEIGFNADPYVASGIFQLITGLIP